ncbi:MAG: hypothetical protein AVDCRST_MAG85-2133 [uncultured Solirubrobacteraceae bacterium]|uniref:Uncharacterized protein n=1 Tax=uncultured Solirubrobacteraceae bacterium TaxID=1162706 RepID=A0A6J4SWQ9_9ACTN|nr:MAG: hypothetical protein AVDCRST_MAG85-2133 [uncultured Solirubrobacteraceae bacterium]
MSTIDDVLPITTSPDLTSRNGFYRMVRRCMKERSRDALRAYVRVPADTPKGFATKSLAELAASLATTDEAVAKALLDEAEATFQEPHDRIESAERRATTLQGTVAIAASVATASGGLLLDPSKINGQTWRAVVAILLLLFIACLVGCAMRAVAATSRIYDFEDPGPDRITDRVSKDKCAVLTYRAAELLRASAVAHEIGRAKVGLLRSAAWWFRLAIFVLAVLGVVIALYAIVGPQPEPAAAAATART